MRKSSSSFRSYHGNKFTLEGVSECILYKLGPFGIKIILVEPGPVGSNFWKKLKMTLESSNPILI